MARSTTNNARRNTRSRPRSNGRRASNYRNHQERGLISKAILMTATVLIPAVGLGAGGYFAWQYINTERLDTVTMCYERDDQHQTAAFIDFSFTSSTNDAQGRDFINALTQTFNQMPANGRLDIFTTARDSSSTIANPVFTLCRPAETASEQKSIAAPDKTSTVIKRDYENAKNMFEIYLKQLFADAKDPDKAAGNSPILEQIAAISRYRFPSGLNSFLLFTDGIQNSSNGHFCAEIGELPSYAKFAERPSFDYIKPEAFNGTQVNYLLVEFGTLPNTNLPHCTNAELRTFWKEYFAANGASSVRITPLGF